MNFIVKVRKIGKDSKIPARATDGSAGYDVYAYRVVDKESREVISDLSEPIELKPGERVLISLGVCLEMPETHYVTITSRSGLSTKYGIESCQPAAPIDPDYRGEVHVLLSNAGKNSFMISKHLRVAQMVFIRRETPMMVEVEELSKTKRGESGFGSTGLL